VEFFVCIYDDLFSSVKIFFLGFFSKRKRQIEWQRFRRGVVWDLMYPSGGW
jgi:hypothetical protein